MTISKLMTPHPLFAAVLVVFIGTALSCASDSTDATKSAQLRAGLGMTQSFAVLAGSTVSNTGSSVVTGSIGLSPGTVVSGFPPGLVIGGTIQAATAAALQAQTDNTAAYLALAGQGCTQTLTGQDLGGMTLTPGTYCFSTSAQLTGTLTLDGLGDPAAVFIFQMGSTLTTASNSSVLLINGANSCNVYWQVGSSATLGTGTAFSGSVLALTSITLTTSATLKGQALAQNGAVTLDSNSVSSGGCNIGAVDGGSGGSGGGAGGGAGGGGGSVDAGTPSADGGVMTCGDCDPDLQIDHENCGACGNACSLWQNCNAGTCI